MKYTNNWKKILSVGLGLTLTFGQAAYAELVIPPIPMESGALGSQTGAGIPGSGVTGPGGVQSGTASGGVAGPSDSVTAGSGSAANSGSGAAGNVAAQGAAGNTAAQGTVEKPTVASEGAVLLDAATGKVLFGKNENQQFYPASITKVMTALVVLERCSLSDVVTFSASATSNLESGAVSLDITEGDQLTVEQCLYGLLLKSANEIGNGLAEHVAGSVSAFADLMNAKARSLGCQNTNFRNPHGLNDAEHKTTPYDMALIMRAALQNETFRRIDSTTSYQFPATKKQAARTITMGHKMLYPTDSRYYAGILGGKTGYTSKAGNTLVTGVEKNGVRLIAVVMKSKSTHYADTRAVLDYGFANYAALTGSGAAGGTGAVNGNGGTVSVPGTMNGNSSTAGGPGAANGSGGTGATGTAEESGSAGGPGLQKQGWSETTDGWLYYKQGGSRAANEWQTVDGLDYWFDSNGYMATGWRRFDNGSWYYFKPSIGYMMKNTWVEDGGDWYYLGADGVLLTNTTTPDGYPVNEYGIWVK